MKKIVYAFWLSVFVIACPSPLFAASNVSPEYKNGVFISGGGLIGFEANKIKAFGGGLSAEVGYRFNERFSGLIQTGMVYTRDNADLFFFPIVPTARLHLDNNIFGYLGIGYVAMHASKGHKFSGALAETGKTWNGFDLSFGGGYEFWMSENWSIIPQIGFDYTRIASSNLFTPDAMVNFTLYF